MKKKELSPELEKPYVAAIVAAAGSSSRMQGALKQFEELAGVPLVVRSLLTLGESDWIDELIVAARAQDIPMLLELIRAYAVPKVRSVVAGGSSRQQSVQKALSAISPQTQYIAIHDGARPFVSGQVIADAVISAIRYGGAAAAVPVVDTLKRTDASRMVLETPPRDSLFQVQTPQVFRLSSYQAAAKLAAEKGLDYTDDCQMLEALGETVYLSHGSYENFKVTTPVDLLTAQAFALQEEQAYGNADRPRL